MIDITKSFTLFADASVEYNGRASSILKRGRYLIIHKSDGSFLISGSNNIPYLNYQGPSAILTKSGCRLISTRKKEIITVIIFEELSYTELDGWSNNKINIIKTEKDLVNKLKDNIPHYLGCIPATVILEYPTDLGPIDLFVIDDKETKHIAEVKRRSVSIKDITQLKRYMECFDNKAIGHIASPKIGTKALKYCLQNNLKWVQIDFD